MWKDPIVQEVRKAGENLAEKANYKVNKFFSNLRENEKQRKLIVVSRENRKLGATKI